MTCSPQQFCNKAFVLVCACSSQRTHRNSQELTFGIYIYSISLKDIYEKTHALSAQVLRSDSKSRDHKRSSLGASPGAWGFILGFKFMIFHDAQMCLMSICIWFRCFFMFFPFPFSFFFLFHEALPSLYVSMIFYFLNCLIFLKSKLLLLFFYLSFLSQEVAGPQHAQVGGRQGGLDGQGRRGRRQQRLGQHLNGRVCGGTEVAAHSQCHGGGDGCLEEWQQCEQLHVTLAETWLRQQLPTATSHAQLHLMLHLMLFMLWI